jgi:DNA-binding transcriptional MocR family regulator
VLAVLPEGHEERRIVAEARARKLGLYGLDEHRIRTRGEPALVLGYAVAGESTIPSAVRELAAAVKAASA